MKTSLTTKVLLATGLLALLWHLKIATSAKTKIAGLFMAKPGQPGYVWSDIGNADSRFFWDIAEVKWRARMPHPGFSVVSADKQGDWLPKPGYIFVNKAIDLTTVWQSDQLHPDYMALSDKSEGNWLPVSGYKFVYKDGEIMTTVWEPNKRYDALKIVTLTQQDQYKPFPGYKFIEPGKSLKVAWMPGLVSSDNPRLMAGTQEGSWVVTTLRSPVYRTTTDGSGNTFGKRLARRMANRAADRFVDRTFGY